MVQPYKQHYKFNDRSQPSQVQFPSQSLFSFDSNMCRSLLYIWYFMGWVYEMRERRVLNTIKKNTSFWEGIAESIMFLHLLHFVVAEESRQQIVKYNRCVIWQCVGICVWGYHAVSNLHTLELQCFTFLQLWYSDIFVNILQEW